MFPTIKRKSKPDAGLSVSPPSFEPKQSHQRTISESPAKPAPTGLVDAIAQVLSSVELREQFELSPEVVADQLAVATEDRQAFVELDAEQLKRQSNTLLNKRWHEVRRLVPLTIELLDEQAGDVFRFYATNDWPIGHRRHPADAFRFLQFLIANKIQEPNQAELKKMRRLSAGQNL